MLRRSSLSVLLSVASCIYTCVDCAYTELNHTCFPNGTIEIYNPDAILFTSLLAVQDEGLSNATICAMTISGTQHTITNCSQDRPIVVFFSNRTWGYRHTLGSQDSESVAYEIQCNDLPDAGINRTVADSLDVTLEVSTQDIVTPSFTVTSAIRSHGITGPVVTQAEVGDTLYWTVDIPVNYTAKMTCDAYSGDSTSGVPSHRLFTGGCSDDDDLLGGDFNSTDDGPVHPRRYYVTLYAFKFYNSDDVFLHCIVTVCPTGSSTCIVTGCSKKRRSIADDELSPDDQQFTTGSLLHIVDQNTAASSIPGTLWMLLVVLLLSLHL